MSLAKNSFRAKQLFNFRKGYAMQEPVEGNIKNTYIAERLNVGKMDLFDSPIIPRQELIIPVRNVFGTNNVSALNFVATAFDAAASRFRAGIKEEKYSFDPVSNSSDTSLDMFVATKGYTDPYQQYFAYNNILLNQFSSILAKDNIMKRRIINFETYIEEFMELFLSTTDSPPIFFKDFIFSRYCDQLSSGLIIETHTADYDNDEYKTINYNSNPNYVYFSRMARNFGFNIDKNIPWRLVADINSTQMRSYIYLENPDLRDATQEQLTTNAILDKFYRTPEEIILMLQILQTSYNQFIAREPNFKQVIEKGCGVTTGPLITRTPGNFRNLDILSSRNVLHYYVKFKNKFHRINFTQGEMETILNKVDTALATSSFLEAVKFITLLFSFNDNLEGSTNYTYTRYNLALSNRNERPDELISQAWKQAVLKL